MSVKSTSTAPSPATCGSGVTAAVVLLAAELAGAQGDLSLYDGSWAEYASKLNAVILSDQE